MTQEQRQFILDTIEELKCDRDNDVVCGLSWPEIQTLIDFARQQLSLRVDGEKLLEKMTNSSLFSPQCVESESHSIVTVWSSGAAEQLEALVMECLTTEEKE
jgi:hypothetical protein